MTRRTTIAALAALAGGLLVGASVLAYAGQGGRHGHMQRFAAAAIDDALDTANVTPEQRQQIHAIRDRLFAAFAEQRRAHPERLEETLALFEGDRLDAERLAALRQQHGEQHARMAEAVTRAFADAHAVLTPEQRAAVADYVRDHARRHRH
jgi:protein CpxP